MEYHNKEQVNLIIKKIEDLEELLKDIERVRKETTKSRFLLINGAKIPISSCFLSAERTVTIIQIEQLKKKLLPL